MATVLSELWTAGNSLFTSVDVYDLVPDGADPLYPFMLSAEGVTINGSGKLDWKGVHGDYQTSGVWLRGFGPLALGYWDASKGSVQSTYRPNATAIAAMSYAPLIDFPRHGGVGPEPLLIDADIDIAAIHIEAGGWTEDIDEDVPFTFAADTDYTIKACWKCGTVVGDFDDVLADGYLRVFVNNVLILERTDFALYFSTDQPTPNALDGIWLGYYGLLGENSGVILRDSECSAGIPNKPPPAPIVPCEPESTVTNGGKGKSGCNDGGAGFIRTYVGPFGDVPLHANPADGESLTNKERAGLEVWVELRHVDYPSGDVTIHRRAFEELGDPAAYEGGRKQAGLLEVGEIEHAIGNEQGSFEAATIDLGFSDTLDRLFRNLADDQDVDGDEVTIKIASDAAREGHV